MKKGITLFKWGYAGWGNHTPQLVKAIDAIERARGFKPPVFVDIRINRGVRAAGFVHHAFEKTVGQQRYKWMQDLGNESILTHESRIKIRRPAAANDLLDEAIRLGRVKRRLIFFCSCPWPNECHRDTVRDFILKNARKRRLPVRVVEWPEETPTSIALQVSSQDFNKLRKTQKSIPLSRPTPLARFAGLPWGTVAIVSQAGCREKLFFLTGPARCWSKSDWYLPIVTRVEVMTFDRQKQSNADARFREWCAENPSGFYLNEKSHGQCMLHNTTCDHAGDLSPGSSPTKHAKHCSLAREALEWWAKERGAHVRLCNDCL